ncbi:nicotinate (nicotinamide) nucleotide adenylyltransferase [Anaerococcus sp. AGMB00486]|uniref:Probable nicotinate-nucleotide adenylyltransferase n=2 Tax=Anaerococcus TaxID=165779 RepID=A0ABX2N7J5_9FIRM|nr:MULTISPECIES: nicotinate (nicotinamide) nucleotide adenylyltransferase [Anaerococcus]MDY3005470.1 nicotinate (nicotinamide) nucleotide adenylyltransferase [Anaerococcus porci]MSS76898.1 nicotinate (nicotinamide) nucleotide adenylyltransferase [Anaerococcus porci]NVF10618.1 nicotinate (nicotinamide) nucleotide adenylyltransferase [Anaerococcus faecalis]
MKIGLFGGTFDPIHVGHLIVMENCINLMGLDKIFILPNSNPPHKLKNHKSSTEIRVKMVKEAIKDNPRIEINDYDYKDNNIHYTFQTIEYFVNAYNEDEIFFIMGEDSFLEIETWKNYKRILENNIIVFKRYSDDGKKIKNKLNHYSKFRDNIFIIDNLVVDISSSLIRKLVMNKKSIKYLVTDDVELIIKKKDLYV